MLYNHLRKAVCVSLSLAMMCGVFTGFTAYEEEETAIDDIAVVEETEESDGEVAIVPEEVVTDEVSIDPALGTDDDEGDELPIVPEGETPIKVVQRSISMSGYIILYFYMNIPQEFRDDAGAKITINDVEYPLPAPQSNGSYKFGYSLAAAQIFDDVTFVATKGDGSGYPIVDKNGVFVGSSYTFSVQGYIDLAREQLDPSVGKNALFLEMMDYLSEYGKYARVCFNYKKDTIPAFDPDIAADMETIDLDTLNNFKYEINKVTTSSLTYDVSSLSFDSCSRIYHYFNLASGADINDYTFTITDYKGDSISYSRVEKEPKGSRYRVVIDNIPAAWLGNAYHITVTGPDLDQTNPITIDYSGISYPYRILEVYGTTGGTDAQKAWRNVGRILYLYYEAAAAYFA